MAKGMSMKVLLSLQTKEFQKGLYNIRRQLNGFKNFMKSAFALGSVTMFGKQMIQVSKDFEDAMARVQAVSNATQDEFRAMQAEAERLGSTTRYTASEAASALENLTRNGMSATRATKALSEVLALAQANSIDLATAADIMTNNLNMFNLGVEQATRVSDVLSSTAANAATDITSLNEAMVNAAPIANVLGFSIEEVASAIGALAQQGLKGAAAGTNLRIVMQKLADPKVIAKLHKYGVEIDENSMKTEGLKKTIERLAEANLSLEQLGPVFSKSATAVQQLIGGLDDLDRLLEVTKNSAGTTARMMEQSVGSVQKELDTLKSKYEGLLISIGKQTSGVVKGAVKLLQDLIDNFKTIGGTIANIASVAVPLLTKRVLTLAQSTKTMFAQIAAGAATAKAAMGGLVTIIATLVTWVGSAFYTAWRKSTQAMRDAEKKVADLEDEMVNLEGKVKSITEKLNGDSNSVNSALAKAIQLFPEFENVIRNAARVAATETNKFETLKGVLEDILRLKKLNALEEGQTEIQAANGAEIGRKLYQSSKFRGGEWWNPSYTQREGYDKYAKEIRKQLKAQNLPEESIEKIFNRLGDIIVQNKDYEQTIEDLTTQLQKYSVQNARNLATSIFATIPFSSKTEDNFYKGRGAAVGTDWAIQQQAEQEYKILSDDWARNKKAEDELLKKGQKTHQDYQKSMEGYSESFINAILRIEGITDEKVNEAFELVKGFYPPKTTSSYSGGGGESGAGDKVKTDADKVKDAIDDYNEEVTKLNNRLSAGTISQKEYEQELDKVEDKTWEAITSISKFADILEKIGKGEFGEELKNKYIDNRNAENAENLSGYNKKLSDYMRVPEKGERSRGYSKKSASEKLEEDVKISLDYADALDKFTKDLKAAIEKGEFGPIKGDALVVLESLKTKAKEAAEAADTLQAKLDLSEAIAKLDEQIKALNMSFIDTFEGFAGAMDRITSGLWAIAEVFDEDLKESPMFQAFERFNSVLNSSIQIMQGVMEAIQLVKVIQAKAAAEKVKDAAAEVAANKMATQSEMEKAGAEASAAAAGGANAVANIPYVGPALAVAAAASIVTALLAAFAKFEKGGIVAGNSYSGDRNLVRANSSEMILTRAQQGTLWNMLNGKGGTGGGNVQFTIKGEDLVGTLNNYNRLRR